MGHRTPIGHHKQHLNSLPVSDGFHAMRHRCRPVCQARAGGASGQEDARRAYQQPVQLQQTMQQLQQQPGVQQEQQGQALTRRPLLPTQQAVAIEMSQVVGKQVITRTTGRNLGVISAMWVDPVRKELVSLVGGPCRGG